MAFYEAEMTVGAARDLYFDRAGLEPGYDKRWVRLQAGPVVFGFPNTNSRRRAVRLHDLHHVLTGYDTDWVGEGEISCFEIGGGCGGYGFAWFINLQGWLLGLALAPRRAFRAFLRGRRAITLYRQIPEFDDSLLERTVGDLRERIQLDRDTGPTTGQEWAAFIAWTCASLLLALGPVVALGLALAWLL